MPGDLERVEYLRGGQASPTLACLETASTWAFWATKTAPSKARRTSGAMWSNFGADVHDGMSTQSSRSLLRLLPPDVGPTVSALPMRVIGVVHLEAETMLKEVAGLLVRQSGENGGLPSRLTVQAHPGCPWRRYGGDMAGGVGGGYSGPRPPPVSPPDG